MIEDHLGALTDMHPVLPGLSSQFIVKILKHCRAILGAVPRLGRIIKQLPCQGTKASVTLHRLKHIDGHGKILNSHGDWKVGRGVAAQDLFRKIGKQLAASCSRVLQQIYGYLCAL